MNSTRYLAASLFLLAAVFVAWSLRHTHPLAGLLVFALPPALLALGAIRQWPRIGFFASTFALFWFSHGVMLLWSQPESRGWTAAEVALSLLVIHAACLPGYRARRNKRQQAAP